MSDDKRPDGKETAAEAAVMAEGVAKAKKLHDDKIAQWNEDASQVAPTSPKPLRHESNFEGDLTNK